MNDTFRFFFPLLLLPLSSRDVDAGADDGGDCADVLEALMSSNERFLESRVSRLKLVGRNVNESKLPESELMRVSPSILLLLHTQMPRAPMGLGKWQI
jgi:hypothetical protein